MNRRLNTKMVFVVLLVLLGGVILASLTTGQINVPLRSLAAITGAQLGFSPETAGNTPTPEQLAVIWHLRLPRTLVGILVGAALAVSGAVMQGVFGNPLADPGIIGVSAGASLGAVIAVSLGLTSLSLYYMPIFALIGALLAVAVTVALALRNGRIPVMTLLLAGVAVSMFTSAVASAILTFMNEYRLREFLFWMVGGLDYRRWEHVFLALGPILVGLLILCFLAPPSERSGAGRAGSPGRRDAGQPIPGCFAWHGCGHDCDCGLCQRGPLASSGWWCLILCGFSSGRSIELCCGLRFVRVPCFYWAAIRWGDCLFRRLRSGWVL